MAVIFTVTDAGRAALVNAQRNGTKAVLVATVGVTATAFAPGQAPPSEIKRIATISGGATAADTIHVTIFDTSADSYTVRGYGLYLDDGTLFASYGQAAVIVEKSTGATMALSVDAQFKNIDATQITFGDTNFANPAATVDVLGVVKLADDATTTTGTDSVRAVTPKSLLAALNARFGAGAPSDFIKSLLTKPSVLAFCTALGIRGAAQYDTGAGNGLDADLLDGQHGGWYRAWANITGVPETATRWPSWSEVTGKPTSYTIGDITGLQNALDGKLNITGGTLSGAEWHAFGDVGTQQVFEGYGWKNAVIRWKVAMEADGKYALYSYAADGTGAEQALMVSSGSTGGRDLKFYNSNVWHAANFDPNSKANVASPTFTGGMTVMVGATGRMRLIPLASGYGIDSITPDGSAYAPFKISATSIDLGTTNVTCGGWTTWHAQNFNPASKADIAGAAFTGAISANGQISAINSALRASGWGTTLTDGVVYFGKDNSYIYKTGNQFSFNNEQGGFNAFLATGGTIWTSGNFNPANYLPLAGGTITNGAITMRNGNYQAIFRADTSGIIGFINQAANAWNWSVDDNGSTTQRGNAYVGGTQTIAGSLGVGGSPATRLDVYGPYGRILFHNGGSSYNNIQSVNSGNNAYVPLDFTANGYNFHGGNVTVDGAVIAGGGFQYSDRRLKRDIKPLAVERGLAIKLARAFAEWRRRSDGKRDVGIEAQKLRGIASRYVVRGPERGTLAGLLAVDKAGAALEASMDNALHLQEHHQSIHELLERVARLEGKA